MAPRRCGRRIAKLPVYARSVDHHSGSSINEEAVHPPLLFKFTIIPRPHSANRRMGAGNNRGLSLGNKY